MNFCMMLLKHQHSRPPQTYTTPPTPSSIPIIIINDPAIKTKTTHIIEEPMCQLASLFTDDPSIVPLSTTQSPFESTAKHSSNPFTSNIGNKIPIPSTFSSIPQGVYSTRDTTPLTARDRARVSGPNGSISAKKPYGHII